MPYISLDELDAADAARSMARFSDEQKLEAIRMAQSEADSYLAKVYAVPVPDDKVTDVLQMQIVRMVKYILFSENGFSLQGDDQIVRDNYDLARKFFMDIAASKAVLGPGMEEPVVDVTDEEGPYVYSDDDRGFGGTSV